RREDLRQGRLEPLLLSSGDRDLRAVGRERRRHREPQARSPARDEDGLAREDLRIEQPGAFDRRLSTVDCRLLHQFGRTGVPPGGCGACVFLTTNVSWIAGASPSATRTLWEPSVVSTAGPSTIGSQIVRPGSPS